MGTVTSTSRACREDEMNELHRAKNLRQRPAHGKLDSCIWPNHPTQARFGSTETQTGWDCTKVPIDTTKALITLRLCVGHQTGHVRGSVLQGGVINLLQR